MLAIGRHHLAWGSADQPPLAPALTAVSDWLAPGSLLVLRVPVALATGGAVVVVALIAREFGGDRRAQLIAGAAQAGALWLTIAGHWLTPYSLEPVEWLLLIWLLVRWIRVREDRLLVAVGAVAGVAMETKFQVFLLCAVLFASVAAFGPRELLRRRMLWVGVALALALSLPTLVWQAANGWPQLRMGAVVASESEELYGGRPGVAVALIGMAGITGTVLCLYGLWQLLRREDLRPYRFLGVATVALYVFFVITVGRFYYLGGMYGPLFAAGAVGLQYRRLSGGRWAWLVWPACVVNIATVVGMLLVADRATQSDVPQAIAERTAEAYEALPPEDRARIAILGQSYIIAAYLDVYSPPGSLPNAYSTNRSYGYFSPPPESSTDALYVGAPPDELRPYFNLCRKLSDYGESQEQWLCTGRNERWQIIWPRLRHLRMN
ncbi:glycosyl transferase family 39 [Nocardia sp. ET3-3]|uniref:Glycosyl transferase family 39 n=2 Tax=Nocardia terrae TaxID=2675851 RepID=A0A7K1UTP0_9NOCA|nr:glycosyl transferase family 39 [Nocardia terrae]